MNVDPERPFFATAAAGSEGVLRDELRELRLPRVRADRGGVHFGGELEHGIRACLRSRIALRVLRKVARFPAPDPDALYRGAGEVDWATYLDVDRSFAINASVRDGQLRHSGFVVMRVKDAVVDQLRDPMGARPSVERGDPDLRISVRIVRDEAELYVDLSGEPLHRRGYRTQAGEAPLKEHLAAAILRLCDWRPGIPLLDPMCGSGTFCIEAAAWAAGLPAGGKRRFGFERWRDYNEEARASFALERQRAEQFANPVPTPIRGSDRDGAAVNIASANAQRAGVSVEWSTANVFDSRPPPPGTCVVMNPPYGVRLASERRDVDELASAIRRMKGSRVAVLTPLSDLSRAVRLKPTREHTLHNGDLKCRLYVWQIQ